MNRDKYLENIEIKNRRLLLKIYKKHINKLKIQIYEATERGNDTVYLQNLHNQVEKEIIQFEKELKQYSAGAVKTSYESGAKTAVVGDVAKEIAGTYVFGSANNQAMQALAKTTYQPLSKMAQQIGRATLEYMKRENFQDTQSVLKALGKFVDSEYLRKTGIEGIGNVVVGSETWQTAARKIRDKIISEANIKVPYYNKKGDVIRYVHAQDYAKMVSRTTTANVFREGAKDRILDTWGDDGDLVEIIGNSDFPNSPCIPYQGQILSLEGQTKGYTTIKEAKANGLFHPNCIHNFAVTDKVIAIYNGEDYKQKKDVEEIKKSSIDDFRKIEINATKELEKINTTKEIANEISSLGEFLHKVDLDDIPKDVANELFIATKKVFNKYPQLKGGSSIKVEPLDSDVYADNMSFITAIHLNSRLFKSKEILIKSWNRDVELGFHPINTTFRGIIIHEFGHSLHSYIELNYGKKPADIKRDVLKIAGIKKGSKEIKEKLSEYATRNPKEFFAEAFTEYLESPNPRKIAKTFGEYIDKILKN